MGVWTIFFSDPFSFLGSLLELFVTFVPIGNTNWETCVSSWAIFCLGFVYFEIFQEFVQKPLAVLSQSVWDWQDEMSLVKHFKMWNRGKEGGGTKREREKRETPLDLLIAHTASNWDHFSSVFLSHWCNQHLRLRATKKEKARPQILPQLTFLVNDYFFTSD